MGQQQRVIPEKRGEATRGFLAGEHPSDLCRVPWTVLQLGKQSETEKSSPIKIPTLIKRAREVQMLLHQHLVGDCPTVWGRIRIKKVLPLVITLVQTHRPES